MKRIKTTGKIFIMGWVAVDKDGEEWIFNKEPLRANDYWESISANVVFFA